MSDIIDITQDEEAEDVGDFDALREAIVARVTAEIADRKSSLKDAYPFEISESGRLLCLRENLDLGSTVYVFCLIMSHVSQSPLLEKFDLTAETRSGRDVFQICATLAAAGYCEGPAISFGWPRTDQSSFAKKLAETYQLFGDGTPRQEPLPAAPSHIKDGGIDVISWKPTIDKLPGALYLIGQVASGNNWPDKSVLNDIKLFHWAWFDVAPSAHANGAMFVPFCITDTGEASGEFKDQEYLVSKMQFLVKSFGHFFYRYKIPHYVNVAVRIAADGIKPIEGLTQADSIRNWVEKLRGRLVEVRADA